MAPSDPGMAVLVEPHCQQPCTHTHLDGLSRAGDEGFPFGQLSCIQVKLLWVGLNNAFIDS